MRRFVFPTLKFAAICALVVLALLLGLRGLAALREIDDPCAAMGALSSRPEGWRGLEGKIAFRWGARDTTTPPQQQGQALADLSKGPIILLPDVGQIPKIEDKAAFYVSLLQSLQQFGPAAP